MRYRTGAALRPWLAGPWSEPLRGPPPRLSLLSHTDAPSLPRPRSEVGRGHEGQTALGEALSWGARHPGELQLRSGTKLMCHFSQTGEGRAQPPRPWTGSRRRHQTRVGYREPQAGAPPPDPWLPHPVRPAELSAGPVHAEGQLGSGLLGWGQGQLASCIYQVPPGGSHRPPPPAAWPACGQDPQGLEVAHGASAAWLLGRRPLFLLWWPLPSLDLGVV